MYKDYILERKSKNKLNPAATKSKLDQIAKAAEQNVSMEFVARVGKVGEPVIALDDAGEECKVYRVTIRVAKRYAVTPSKEKIALQHFRIAKEAMSKIAKENNWEIVQEIDDNGLTQEPLSRGVLGDSQSTKNEFILPELTPFMLRKYFSGIYERDAHIKIIHRSAKAYIDSVKANSLDNSIPIRRSHVLLKGKPAGCKTTLFERFKAFYDNEGSQNKVEGEEGPERVVFVDGPTMTKAGLENWLISLASSGSLPEFIVVEEIEKQDMNNLLTLISLMGSGYLAKMNARIGRVQAKANTVIWATCNDEQVIKQFQKGALWSRFTHHLHCSRPSRELMRKILLERIELMGGDEEWADKAIEFAYETVPSVIDEEWDDPRKVLGLLDGGELLMDGTWQSHILEVLRSEQEEIAQERKRENKDKLKVRGFS